MVKDLNKRELGNHTNYREKRLLSFSSIVENELQMHDSVLRNANAEWDLGP